MLTLPQLRAQPVVALRTAVALAEVQASRRACCHHVLGFNGNRGDIERRTQASQNENEPVRSKRNFQAS
jgi:hypothetical protein